MMGLSRCMTSSLLAEIMPSTSTSGLISKNLSPIIRFGHRSFFSKFIPPISAKIPSTKDNFDATNSSSCLFSPACSSLARNYVIPQFASSSFAASSSSPSSCISVSDRYRFDEFSIAGSRLEKTHSIPSPRLAILSSSNSSSSSVYSHSTIFDQVYLKLTLTGNSLLSSSISRAFSTSSSAAATQFDRGSSTFKRINSPPKDTSKGSPNERKTTPGDPTGRRKKDKVGVEYELIASCDTSNQTVIPLASYGGIFVWSLAALQFCTTFIPACIYRPRFVPLSHIIFQSDSNLLLLVGFVLGTAIVTTLKYVTSRYMLRLYINRKTEEYCVVNQGFIGPRKHYFTDRDVRLVRNTHIFQPNYILNGRGYFIDTGEFKNLRDYNQMVRHAKKLQ